MEEYTIDELCDNPELERLEMQDVAGGTGLPDEAPLTQWEKVKAAGMREEYEQRLADDRRNQQAEADLARAESEADREGIWPELRSDFVRRYVAEAGRVRRELAEERRA